MAEYELRHLARPYARAVFEIAVSAKALDAWSEMLSFMKIVIQNKRILAILRDPVVKQEQIVELLFSMNQSLWNEERQHFLQLLAENHRIVLLPEIADLFAKYRADYEKTIEVEVQSAFTLSSAQQERLKPILSVFLQRKITLKCTEDVYLLGGFIARAGDWVMDASLRGKLNALKDQIKQ